MYLVLLDLLGHLLKEGLFSSDSRVEDSLFQVRQPVVLPVKVLLKDEHTLSIGLRYAHDRVQQIAHYPSHTRLEVEPHELVGWVSGRFLLLVCALREL